MLLKALLDFLLVGGHDFKVLDFLLGLVEPFVQRSKLVLEPLGNLHGLLQSLLSALGAIAQFVKATNQLLQLLLDLLSLSRISTCSNLLSHGGQGGHGGVTVGQHLTQELRKHKN